jgi:hypothetical protein
VVGPERPAVDKLLAEEVLVSDVKAAEDLNLGPLATAPAASESRSRLYAVGGAKFVQEVGQFGPKVLENRMFRDVGPVFIG